jgi:hypothetical protein
MIDVFDGNAGVRARKRAHLGTGEARRSAGAKPAGSQTTAAHKK